jgi:hypothetical protein
LIKIGHAYLQNEFQEKADYYLNRRLAECEMEIELEQVRNWLEENDLL